MEYHQIEEQTARVTVSQDDGVMETAAIVDAMTCGSRGACPLQSMTTSAAPPAAGWQRARERFFAEVPAQYAGPILASGLQGEHALRIAPGDPQVTPSILRMAFFGEPGVCGVRDFNDLTGFVGL